MAESIAAVIGGYLLLALGVLAAWIVARYAVEAMGLLGAREGASGHGEAGEVWRNPALNSDGSFNAGFFSEAAREEAARLDREEAEEDARRGG